MTKYRHVFPDVKLTGNKDTIKQLLGFLTESGCKWESDGKYYPVGRLERNYYLRKFRGPLRDTNSDAQSDDPQPRPWDAVLGDKNNPKK
ncbi:MAG: hypothetical protein ACRC62_10955 [Microcoleus sp.]